MFQQSQSLMAKVDLAFFTILRLLDNQAQNIGKTSSNNYVSRREGNQQSFCKPLISKSFLAQFSEEFAWRKAFFHVHRTHRLEKCGWSENV
jgi:hypothetical protein